VSAPRACPRCASPLAAVEPDGVPFEACAACKGLLVPQLALAGLLEATSARLLGKYDPDAELEPTRDRGGRTDCPSCGRRMEVDDYCSANLVLFDRCPDCELLWLDPGKLGTMALMWARMEARIARVRAENRALEKDLADFVSIAIFIRGPY
jgi:Zn-finger nucleic acid-binding protein